MFTCTQTVAWSFSCSSKQPGTPARCEIAGRQGCAATSSVCAWGPTPGRRALSNVFTDSRRGCRRDFEGQRVFSCRAASAPSAPPPPVPAWPPGRAPRFDVLTLSNLAVDVLTPVARLPSSDLEVRRGLLAQLMAREPSPEALEAGGSTNLCFTASRLGLKAGAVGCCSRDVYGRFLRRCLEVRCCKGKERWMRATESRRLMHRPRRQSGCRLSHPRPFPVVHLRRRTSPSSPCTRKSKTMAQARRPALIPRRCAVSCSWTPRQGTRFAARTTWVPGRCCLESPPSPLPRARRWRRLARSS